MQTRQREGPQTICGKRQDTKKAKKEQKRGRRLQRSKQSRETVLAEQEEELTQRPTQNLKNCTHTDRTRLRKRAGVRHVERGREEG